jgi:DNA-binding CsgD family transcriptional regulator
MPRTVSHVSHPSLSQQPERWQHRRMWRTILAYGLALAAIALFLQWIEYRYFVRLLRAEIYIALVAVVFVALGVWVGIRLTPARPAEPFELNLKMVASLGLTPRECEVLSRLAKGQSNKEIARALGSSPNTVKTQVASIYAKLGVAGRGKAVDAARVLSLVP